MAYVGLSRVYSGLDNPEAAQRFLDKAKALAPGASDRERRRIEIRGKQLAAMEDLDDAARSSSPTRRRSTTRCATTSTIRSSGSCAATPRSRPRPGGASAAPPRRSPSTSACCSSSRTTPPPITTSSTPTRRSAASTRRSSTARSTRGSRRRSRTPPTCGRTTCGAWAASTTRSPSSVKADALERAYYAAEGHRPRLRLAPRPQPRPAGHLLPAQGADAARRGDDARGGRRCRPADAYRAFNRKELPNFLIHRARYAEALEAARAMTRGELPAGAGGGPRARRPGAARARDATTEATHGARRGRARARGGPAS